MSRHEVDITIICWCLDAGRQARLWDALCTPGDVRQLFGRLVEGSETLEAASLALLQAVRSGRVSLNCCKLGEIWFNLGLRWPTHVVVLGLRRASVTLRHRLGIAAGRSRPLRGAVTQGKVS